MRRTEIRHGQMLRTMVTPVDILGTVNFRATALASKAREPPVEILYIQHSQLYNELLEILKHNSPLPASQVIKNGGVIVYPTDTVWGLGCNALDTAAVAKLRKIKQKPANAPLIWLLPSVKAVQKFCGELTREEIKLLNRKHTTVIIHGQGVRVVKNGWLNKFVQACQVPVVSTSANLHGQPTVQSWRQAVALFGEQVDAVVHGRRVLKNTPSTVVQVKDGQTQVLRGISIK